MQWVVSGRGLLTGGIERLSVAGGPWQPVLGWAGPWPVTERWWSVRRHRARLQVVTANLDACAPMPASFAGAPLVALADAHLRGHSDAIERGMTYTADNQLRLLHPES